MTCGRYHHRRKRNRPLRRDARRANRRADAFAGALRQLQPKYTVRHGSKPRNWASAVNCDGRYGVSLLAACAALLLPQLGAGAATNALRYDRASIATGQWWRLLTAHIAHLGLHHAILNMVGLVFLWALFAREWRPREWAVIILLVAAAIDGGLWFRDPQVAWYVGASGVLHGIMAAGVLACLRRHDPLGWLMAGLLAAKLAYEQLHGALPFAGRGVPVVVDAHLYGALAGFAAAGFLAWTGSRSRRPRRGGPGVASPIIGDDEIRLAAERRLDPAPEMKTRE